MPCDTIQRTKVEFLERSTDVKLLAKGLRAKGYQVTETTQGLNISRNGLYGSYHARTGQLDIPRSWDSQEFKRAYSKEVVNSQAEAFGWSVTWSTNDQGEEEAQVEKSVY